ncbi:MAG: hybrid sensor histidine kinase/response regulator [Alphaproteobacteria bacterium]|nr:hybrid sensor histidine kinase/response regulator [Alphaproteobacteria bacterium]
MLNDWTILVASLAYIGILFAIASWGDRASARHGPRIRAKPVVYALSLAVYCTSWTFYGSVGLASTSGYDFIPVYLGPILLFTAGYFVLRKIVRIGKAENITTIADFIAARFGKSQTLAAVVTLFVVVGILPYIALQLKAVSTSFNVLVSYPDIVMPLGTAGIPWWADTALVVALLMAVFSIMFGTRNIDATEHHEGMMLAIAFESVVKLVAFLAAGIFVTFFMFGGFGDLFSRAAAIPEVAGRFMFDVEASTWITITLLSLTAIICLPRQFHVAVVENADERELKRAAWLFPGYLIAINIFVIPIAIAGLILFAGLGVDADTFVLTLPMLAQQEMLTLFVFIGGLSAATGMVIVATVALATMISNDVFMPLYLRSSRGAESARAVGATLLNVRRVAMTAILLLAFAYYRIAGEGQALASIGLVSFAGVAQFAPAILIGIFWAGASRAGALSGIVAGGVVWAYTLLLPTFANANWFPDVLLAFGPAGVDWLRPQALFGYTLADPLTHGVFWSLSVNTALLVLVSCVSRPGVLDRSQARAFVEVMAADRASRPRTLRGALTVRDLEELTGRYLGVASAEQAFAQYRADRSPELASDDPVDAGVLRFAERLLASAIGSSSARLVIAMSMEREDIDMESAMSLLDDATAAIQYNRELLQTTMENMRQGIAILDEDLRIAWLNDRFRSYLGLPDMFGRVGVPVEDIIRYSAEHGEYGPGDVESLVNDLLAQYRRHEPAIYERSLADGTVLEVRTSPMPAGGVAVSLMDVTDRVEAARELEAAKSDLELRVAERTRDLTDLNEQLRRASEAAQQANLGKTRFLAAASHDLLQPLNAARLFLSSLGERELDRDNASLVDRVDISLRSVEELLAGLLDISKLDAGGVEPQVEDFRIDELLQALGTEFAALADERGIELRVVTSESFVRSDRRLLRRILQNFLSNAVRYTPAGGKVLIGCRGGGDRVRIEVRDSGPGIPDDKRDAVFQEFQRLQNDDVQDQGLGLGLAIVERIARMLGHVIDLRSVEGAGSVFAVSVPRGEAQRVADEPREPPAFSSGDMAGAIVLCIDDNADVRDGMEMLLGGWGCDVRTAAAGDHWRRAMRDDAPELIIADYHLENGELGPDIVTEVCGVYERVIPAVIVTADPSESLREEAARRGHIVLDKPVKPAALRALMTRMLAQRAAARRQAS